MNGKEDDRGRSEIQFKQQLGNFNLTIQSIFDNEISTITFMLMDSNNENLMNLELTWTDFELFANSLKKFAMIIKDADPNSPAPSPHRPREVHHEFTDFF